MKGLAAVAADRHGNLYTARCAGLRNQGPLEFPTSPVIAGRRLCVTSSYGARRDNFPNAPGEGAMVAYLDEELPVR